MGEVIGRLGILGLLCVAAWTNAESASDGPDVRQIKALYASWRAAVEGADVAGYVAVLHPQVRLLPPGADAINGAANYGQFLGSVFAAATYQIEVLRAPEIRVLGDVAVAEYDYTIHLHQKDPEVGVSEPGALTEARTTSRYFDVLRKQDGKWAVWRHSWQVY
jgi:ketosteroid isomerase-like protein